MNKKLKQNPIDEYLFETLQMSWNNTKKQNIFWKGLKTRRKFGILLDLEREKGESNWDIT